MLAGPSWLLLVLLLGFKQNTVTTSEDNPAETVDGGLEQESSSSSSTSSSTLPSTTRTCICDVKFVGEYCGLILNQKNLANNCTANMYFCGKTNLKNDAILLKLCNQKGFTCDRKLNGGNACYQNFKCHCPKNLNRKGKYCGSELDGPDCQSNIVYRCPMIKRYNASPEDACPRGCKDGKCLK